MMPVPTRPPLRPSRQLSVDLDRIPHRETSHPMSRSSTISFERTTPQTASISFANPPANLVISETVVALHQIVRELDEDPDIQVVVFSSEVPDFFFNHFDGAEAGNLPVPEREDDAPVWTDLVLRLSKAPYVSIAAIRGRTRGAGDELALACDAMKERGLRSSRVSPGGCWGCSRSRRRRPLMEAYAGQQFVGMDLHRRRTVLVRMTAEGEVLERVRIVNDAGRLAAVIARAGDSPEVVVEATYGWYWAVDALREQGARVHLAHPLGVKAFEYRRVKDGERDAADLADLLRMGRLPEAWIAPPKTRELRELVRHRAKLVGLRSHCKAEVHAVLAKCGVSVSMSDLFGVEGTALLDRLELPAPYAARIGSLRRIMDLLEFEIDHVAGMVRGRLALHPGYVAVQTIPGIGPTLAAVLVAEIGDIDRFARPEQLTCWAGLTPKHHESDAHVHRGKITKQGSRLIRWAVVESVQTLPGTTVVGQFRDRVAARRGRNIGVVAAARRQLEYVFYALRDHHVRAFDNAPDNALDNAPDRHASAA